jgi:hypothetical protein
MKYRDYAKKNVPSRTDAEIESAVDGLFGADAEMGEPIEHNETFTKYNVGGYIFYANNSTFDTVESVDEDGNVIESWNLDY